MRGVVRIAFRNTLRQKRRAALLAGAIAFGVMIITLLNAFTSGAVGNIKRNLSYAAGGHIFISGSQLTESRREVGRIGDDHVLRAAVDEKDPRILSIHRRSSAYGSLIFGSRSVMHQIQGVDFAAETQFQKGLQVRHGSVEDLTDPRLLILPAKAAQRLGVEVGETLLVRLQTVTGQENVGEFRVIAVIEDTGSFGMASAYASLGYLNSLIGLEPSEYQMLSVFLADMKDIDAVADEIYQAIVAQGAPVERPYAGSQLQSYEDLEAESADALAVLFGQAVSKIVEEPWEGTKFSVMTLNEMMQPIVSAMTVLDGIALGIFVIILLITGVGILNTFRMVILERTREIGTMRAFGMQKKTVRGIFLWEAAIISLGGGVIGLALAGIIAAVLSRMTWTTPGLEFFLDNGRFTFAVTLANLCLNLSIVLAMSLLAALLPANAAAKLPPAKALGTHY